MKVVALTRTSSLGPSTRYRVEQYRPALAREGIEIVTRPLFGPLWFTILGLRPAWLRLPAKALYSLVRLVARLGQLARLPLDRPDLVLVEQQLFPYLPGWVEALLWPRVAPTLLEFDDAIFLTWGHAAKLRRLCGLADVVQVGNDFLADFARATARQVRVVPTTVDPARYHGPVAPRDDDVLRVAWIGLPYNLGYLDVLAEPLAALAAAGRRCQLRVISSALPDDLSRFAGVDVVLRPWSEAGEADELRACDVGVMPLPDTPWAAGKCGLKLLQCMAAGLAVVASPVGVNTDIVRDGEHGLLAATPAEWRSALERLAADPDLRARLGAAGRRRVAERYSLERGARLVAETYRLACPPRRPPA